jgi:hypothetical protein
MAWIGGHHLQHLSYLPTSSWSSLVDCAKWFPNKVLCRIPKVNNKSCSLSAKPKDSKRKYKSIKINKQYISLTNLSWGHSTNMFPELTCLHRCNAPLSLVNEMTWSAWHVLNESSKSWQIELKPTEICTEHYVYVIELMSPYHCWTDVIFILSIQVTVMRTSHFRYQYGMDFQGDLVVNATLHLYTI